MGSSKAKQRRIYQKEMNLKEKHGKDKEILVHFKDGDKPVVVNPGDVGLSYPSTMFAFKFLISARFCAAVYSHITDCDETFNFWEPSHYLLFGQGFQTWEYAPSYALRSYAYLLVNIVPTWIYNQIFEPNKILLFYFHRCCLSLFCSFCEYYFYRGVCREFGVHIGRLVLLFQLFSTGMFIASCAYLPSSFSMYMTLLSIGAWFQRKYELAVFTTALSAFLSWPFAALIGLPIAVDMLLLRGKWFSFIKWSIISTIIVLIRIDSLYFGRLVVSPLNIVVYNIFSPHGPTLYGVEPWTFYFLNLTLNFNIVFFAAFLTPIFLTLVKLFIGKSSIRPKGAIPYILSLAPLYLWFTVLTLQPHKEESFSNMTRSEGQIRLCLGKEWYRYPSSFFLPNDKWNVSFIKSEFRGQLPTYFQPHLNGTFLQPPNVNDANQEEPSRYVPLEACDFLVDLDTGRSTEWEPNYSNQTEWSVVLSSSYLDNQRTSQYYRLFYIPYLFENNAVFHSYNLLQSKNFTFKTQQ
ncbi:hypothetical protein M8J75_000077 [Diaphorina citri]|nr:hypothetical protein M8J75_000077 [Diaphorina citri]